MVGRVKMPLLAVGKLFRHGWSLVHTEQGLSLEEPRGRHHTPVIFKHNSLAVVDHQELGGQEEHAWHGTKFHYTQ